MDIEYFRASYAHAEEVHQLNSYYCSDAAQEENGGFLKKPFMLNEIEKLILEGTVVVAKYNNEVIGYYLVNDIFQTEVITQRKETIEKLINETILPSGKYVFLTQAAVKKSYKGKGISKEMLRHLKKELQYRFDYFIGFIHKDNITAMNVHLKSGWRVVCNIENGYLAITDTKQP